MIPSTRKNSAAIWSEPAAYHWIRTTYDLAGVVLGHADPSPAVTAYFEAVGVDDPAAAFERIVDDHKLFALAAALRSDGELTFERPWSTPLPIAIPATPYVLTAADGPAELHGVHGGRPDVSQAVAFAVPHSRLGEEVGAAVVLRPGATATADEIRGIAADRLAYFKQPRVLVIVDEIPKGPTGKVQRNGLAARFVLDTSRSSIAPRTRPERDLAHEWCRLLQLDQVGVDDDFFALGGDSLAATEMIDVASDLLGVEIPIVDFLECPTIAGLIETANNERLGASDPTRRATDALALHRGGTEAPIFCVAPHNGNLWRLSRLLRKLGGVWPIYGFRPPRLGVRDPAYTVEELAERYVTALLAAEPDRDPYLIGCCFGGAVAFEMARQLERMGRPAPVLVMINCFNRAWRRGEGSTSPARVRTAHLLRRARFHWSNFAGRENRERLAYLRLRAGLVRDDWLVAARQRVFDALILAGLPRPAVLRDPSHPSTWALQRYVPRPYSGDILMVHTAAPMAGVYPLEHMGWRAVARGKVEVLALACDPLELWSDSDALQQIAAAIRRHLSPGATRA